MAFVFDEAWINNGQLVVASDTVKPPGQGLGKGADRVRHSAYIEGPLQSWSNRRLHHSTRHCNDRKGR